MGKDGGRERSLDCESALDDASVSTPTSSSFFRFLRIRGPLGQLDRAVCSPFTVFSSFYIGIYMYDDVMTKRGRSEGYRVRKL